MDIIGGQESDFFPFWICKKNNKSVRIFNVESVLYFLARIQYFPFYSNPCITGSIYFFLTETRRRKSNLSNFSLSFFTITSPQACECVRLSFPQFFKISWVPPHFFGIPQGSNCINQKETEKLASKENEIALGIGIQRCKRHYMQATTIYSLRSFLSNQAS